MNTATMTSKPSGVIISNLAHFRRVLAVPGVAVKLTRYEIAGISIPHIYQDTLRVIKHIHSSYVVLLDLATGKISRLDFGTASGWSFDGNRATSLSGLGTTYQTLLTYEIHEIQFTTTEQETN